MISFNLLILTFIEMSDQHPIVSRPNISKYKYKLANREAISLINQSVTLFTIFRQSQKS